MAPSFDEGEVMLEQVLLRRAAQCDHKAFAALGSMHVETVYLIARNLSGTEAEALELAEAALQLAWESIGEIPDGISFRTFVCRFLVQLALVQLREMNAFRWAAGGRPASRFDGDGHAAGEWSFARMDAIARRADLAEQLRDALDSLDPEDRAAFVLHVIHELPLQECVEILDIPDADLRQRAHHASLLMTACVRRLMARSTPVHPAVRTAYIQ